MGRSESLAAVTPSFHRSTSSASVDLFTGSERRIQLSDYDGDGDTDALEVPQKTNFVQQTVYWENVGSTTTPHFVGRPSSSTKNPLKQFLTTGPPFGSVQSQLLADLDGDGDRDGFAARVTGIIVLDGLLLENSIVRPSPLAGFVDLSRVSESDARTYLQAGGVGGAAAQIRPGVQLVTPRVAGAALPPGARVIPGTYTIISEHQLGFVFILGWAF